jgi:D-aspartate ligase
VVLCGEGPGAYDIVRCLGRVGIASAVASSEPGNVAFHSRHTVGRLLLPDFKPEYFEEIHARLMAFGRGRPERPVLYAVGDSELMFVTRFREQLDACYRILLPPAEISESLLNKAGFIELARRADLPLPVTQAFADATTLRAALDTVPLPCIVKPAYSQDWLWAAHEQRASFRSYKDALQRFDSRPALLAFCEALPPSPDGFIVQSYIDGRDETIVSFHGYFDEASTCLGWFLTRELRTNPPGAGDIAYCETVHDDNLARQTREHLRRIGFRGIVKVDYKWDARAGEYRMFEIEPHYQTWHLLGAHAGVNLAQIAYHHQRGEPTPSSSAYAAGVRLLYWSNDWKAYWRGYRKTGEWTLGAYLWSMARGSHYRVFDPMDPLPFLYSAVRYGMRKCERLTPNRRPRPQPTA